MKNKITKINSVALSVLMVMSPVNVLASNNEWISENGEWKYKSGENIKTGWFEDQKCWYYADYQTGLLKKGWIASGDAWYYLNPVNSIMQESRWVEDGKFYIGNNGAMATDTIIDGKEILADGSAIDLSESKSVVLTDATELVGKVIEGNLYITQKTANDLVLSDVTVKGKIVIEGGSEITLKNVKATEVKNNKAETTIKLEGTSSIDKVTVSRSTSLLADDKYKGSVKEVAVQSTTKTETIVGVKANEIVSSTYAPTTINKEAGKVTLKQESTVKLNANVEELVINASAGHSKVDVAKDVVVAKATVSSESTLGGEGTITKLEAKVDNITVDTSVNEIIVADGVKNPPTTSDKEVAKPEEGKPSGGAGGGGAGGGGGTGGGETDKGTVSTFAELQSALENSTNITVSKNANIEVNTAITLAEDQTLTIQNGGQLVLTSELTVNGELINYGKILSSTGQPSKVVGRNATNARANTLRLNIDKGRVEAQNGSVFKFDNINQIASSKESFAINENCDVFIGEKHVIGNSDAIIKLEKIQGINDKQPLAYYFVNGDGTVMLAIYGNATISTEKDILDFSVNAQENSVIKLSSTVKMKEHKVSDERRGMINGDFGAKLYIDEKYIMGNVEDSGEKAVFTRNSENQGIISFFTFESKLIGGIRENTTINKEFSNLVSNLYLCPFQDGLSKAVIVTNKSGGDVNLYTFDEGFTNPTILKDGTQKVSVKVEDGKISWGEPSFNITEFLVDTEPVIGERLHILTTPAYADYTVKWTVDDVIKYQYPTYLVEEGDKEIKVELIGREDFIYEGKSQTINVTTKASTTEESLYFKHIGGVEDIKIDNESITYTGKHGEFRLSSDQTLTIGKSGKFILGDLSNYAIFTQMGTLNLANIQNTEIANGEIALISTAKVNVDGKEIIGREGSEIKFLNKDNGEDQLAMVIMKQTNSEKGRIFIYDEVEITGATYKELLENYTFLVKEGGTLTVDGEVPETPVIPDDSKITATTLTDLKAELNKLESEKTIVIEFAESETIKENIKITNRNVEINGDLVFVEEGNITLVGNTKITLNTGANVVMPNFFDLNKDNTNYISAMYGSMLKVGSENILGGVDAQLDVSKHSLHASVMFKFNGDNSKMLTLIGGEVVANGYTNSLLVNEGGVLNLNVGEGITNGTASSNGGSILVNNKPLLTLAGPIVLVVNKESNENIIQLDGKVITLNSDITLNASLPEGFTICTKNQNGNDADFTVNVTTENILASTLGLGEEFLSIGTYTVVNGVWTPNDLKVEDSNQAVDIVVE